MKIVAIGDSYTYGEELANLDNAWPALIQKYTGCTVTNLGDPGTGNTRIVREVVKHVNDYDLFIVAWSHYARVEFSDDCGTFDIWPGTTGFFHCREVRHREKLIKYITRYHNDNYAFQQFLVNAIMLQGYLQTHNKKYIMLNTFNDNITPFLDNEELIRQIDTDCFIGWPTESMQGWAKHTPHGKRGHFLEEGHQLVAEKIYQDIRNKPGLSRCFGNSN